jgi:hypothetical protein
MINIAKGQSKRVNEFKNGDIIMKEFAYIEPEELNGDPNAYYLLQLKRKHQTIRNVAPSYILIDQVGNVDRNTSGESEFLNKSDEPLIFTKDAIKVDWEIRERNKKRTSEVKNNFEAEIIENGLIKIHTKNKGEEISYKEGKNITTEFISWSIIGDSGKIIVKVKADNEDANFDKKGSNNYIFMLVGLDGKVKSYKNNKGEDMTGFKQITYDKSGYNFYLRNKESKGYSGDLNASLMISVAPDKKDEQGNVVDGEQLFSDDGISTIFRHTTNNCKVEEGIFLVEETAFHEIKIEENNNHFHVLNAPSPAATACLSIGQYICDTVSRKVV